MHPAYDPAEIAIGYGNHVALVVDDLDAAVARAASTASSQAARSSPAATACAHVRHRP